MTDTKAGAEETTELYPANYLDLPSDDETRRALERPRRARDYSRILESQCGVADDSQAVGLYDGTLGVTIEYVRNRERPVGQLVWNSNLGATYTSPGNVSGVRWCSGTLIGDNLFLTAGHCFEDSDNWVLPVQNGTTSVIPPADVAANMHVSFNYQVDASGSMLTENEYGIGTLVEHRGGGLDYAIVRLGGGPSNQYGSTMVSPADADEDEMLCIIGHPAGQPKRVEAGPLTGFSGNAVQYNDIDTLGGNSGSGILGEHQTIVGVHTNGGCNQPGVMVNSGVRISSILKNSPTLRAMLASPAKGRSWFEPVMRVIGS